jgi:hypothetical protein
MKNHIPTYEDFVNEDILNDPKAKLWDTKYRINYDDLPANMNLTTAYLNVLFKGIPYQHYAFPQVSDDGNLIFKNQRDLDKAKKILSGKVKSVNEENINLKNISDIDHTRLIKWISQNLYVKSDIDVVKSKDGYTINADKIPSRDKNDLIKYLRHNGYLNESVINEGDMTKFYDGFKVLDFKNKETYKFKYIKGISNAKVEVDAINKLVKATGISQANFTVHGFVKRGEWNKDDTQVFESSVNEAAAKQFDKDVETLIKNIKRGYGWIEPEYVVDSWDNVSDTISFDLVKGEVLKRLFNAGLLYHSSVNGKDKGAKVTLSELGALALMKESYVNEAEKFKATKDFEEFLEEIDGMPEVRIKRIMGSKYIDTPGGYRDEAEDYDNDIVEYMIANMGRKEFEKLHDYWETNIKESSTFIAESAMGDVHIMAEEAATFDEFKAEFIKEYGIGKKDNNKELHDWLQGIWKENHKK